MSARCPPEAVSRAGCPPDAPRGQAGACCCSHCPLSLRRRARLGLASPPATPQRAIPTAAPCRGTAANTEPRRGDHELPPLLSPTSAAPRHHAVTAPRPNSTEDARAGLVAFLKQPPWSSRLSRSGLGCSAEPSVPGLLQRDPSPGTLASPSHHQSRQPFQRPTTLAVVVPMPLDASLRRDALMHFPGELALGRASPRARRSVEGTERREPGCQPEPAAVTAKHSCCGDGSGAGQEGMEDAGEAEGKRNRAAGC